MSRWCVVLEGVLYEDDKFGGVGYTACTEGDDAFCVF